MLLFWDLFVSFLFYGKYPGGTINFCTCVASEVQAGSNTRKYPSNSPAAHGSPLCQCCVPSTPWGRRELHRHLMAPCSRLAPVLLSVLQAGVLPEHPGKSSVFLRAHLV